MPKCNECGLSKGLFELDNNRICGSCKNKQFPPCNSCKKNFKLEELADGLCETCNEKNIQKKKFEDHAKRKAAAKDSELNAIMITTETSPDIEILERIDIITAECAYGMNVFRDLFASVRDVVGGRSGSIQNVLRDARKTCLTELRREAVALGANAVVGVDLDYSEFQGSGNGMLFLVASGTAVVMK